MTAHFASLGTERRKRALAGVLLTEWSSTSRST